MKKKILIVSLAINIIAGTFVFYSFTSKIKNINNAGGYITLNVTGKEIYVTDGNSEMYHADVDYASANKEKLRLAYQTLTKKMNDLNSQGYEIISSNGGDTYQTYVFIKK